MPFSPSPIHEQRDDTDSRSLVRQTIIISHGEGIGTGAFTTNERRARRNDWNTERAEGEGGRNCEGVDWQRYESLNNSRGR